MLTSYHNQVILGLSNKEKGVLTMTLNLKSISESEFETFEEEEDYIIQVICEDCGESYDEECCECDECGSTNMTNSTSHEGVECASCGYTLDMFDLLVAGLVNKQRVEICDDCYNELKDIQ